MIRFVFPVLTLLLSGLAALAAERRDDAGRNVDVPDDPQRIIVLHEPLLGLPLLELGAPVIGSYGRTDEGENMLAIDFIDTVLGRNAVELGISGIGAVGNLDMERMLALKPDLIIGTENDSAQAAQYSVIAPVYIQRVVGDPEGGFAPQRRLAQVVGRAAEFARLEAAYGAQVEAVRAMLPEDGGSFMALILFDQINVVRSLSGAVQALRDLGFERAAWDGGDGVGFGAPISSEAFLRLNPDVLVIMNSVVSEGQGEAAIRARLDQIAPGWERFLKPAREGRVIYAQAAQVVTPTIASARHMLDAVRAWAAARAR